MKNSRKRTPTPEPVIPKGHRVISALLWLPARLLSPLRNATIPLHVQRQLLALLLVVLAAVSGWSLLQQNSDGAVTAWWGDTLDHAAGRAAFLIPMLTFMLAVRSFRTKTGQLILLRHYFGMVGFTLAVAGLLDLAGDERNLGGTLGVGITALLERGLGEVASAILLLAGGVIGVFLLANTDLTTFVDDVRLIWPERKPKVEKEKVETKVDGYQPIESSIEVRERVSKQTMSMVEALGIDLEPRPTSGSTAAITATPIPHNLSITDFPAKATRKPRAAKGDTNLEMISAEPVTPRTPIINLPVTDIRPASSAPIAKAVKPLGPDGPFDLPDVSQLAYYQSVMPDAADLEAKATLIEATLQNFKVEARVREINPGPAVTQFTLEPGVGTKVKRITELQHDLALSLAAPSIRIEAPIPGKARLGIEIPNEQIATVGLREAIESSAFHNTKAKLPLPLGRDVTGRYIVGDLAKMPHLLIAGSTGSGKSVCLNGLISTFLLKLQPSDLKMVMVDPKMVEMAGYSGVPHLQCPVITEMDKVVPILRLCVKEMERRYSIFTRLSVRNLDGYKLRRTEETGLENLPFLVVIVDELADLMMVAPAEVETLLVRLAQKGRACGIHLIIATQRPSADVITGLLKANIAARIAFMVTSQLESRVVLESMGAEKLLGRGDMLFLPPDAPKPVRIQGAFVDDEGVQSIVDHWRRVSPEPRYDPEWMDVEPESSVEESLEDDEDDGLMEQAIKIFRESEDRRASASYLQRRLKIGYNRAARIMERLETEGRVGPPDGPRGRMFLG
jgi:S-DNA-T family DNA segregation ATPase FtsK/SpoIIIE